MNNERSRILKMVSDGKISVEEAERLLDALGSGPVAVLDNKTYTDDARAAVPTYLYVKIISATDDNVDVRVPLNLLRAGIRLATLIPPQAMKHIDDAMDEKGISFDFKNLKPENIEEIIASLSDMEVNIKSATGDTVRVYCA